MDRKLLRNEHDKIIAGVSSGIAEYMEVDATIIRLLFVLSTIFLFGTGILVYLVMWIIVPVNNDPAARYSKFNDYFKDPNRPASFGANPFTKSAPTGEPVNTEESTAQNWTSSSFNAGGFSASKPSGGFKKYPKSNDTGRTVGGLFLLVIGIYFLLNEFNILPFWFSLSKLWPLIFVAIGLSFVLKSKGQTQWEDVKTEEKKSNINLDKDPETNSSTNNPL